VLFTTKLKFDYIQYQAFRDLINISNIQLPLEDFSNKCTYIINAFYTWLDRICSKEKTQVFCTKFIILIFVSFLSNLNQHFEIGNIFYEEFFHDAELSQNQSRLI